jgi:NOL1/NOP2/fmu family ribosome biogenesis protein
MCIWGEDLKDGEDISVDVKPVKGGMIVMVSGRFKSLGKYIIKLFRR